MRSTELLEFLGVTQKLDEFLHFVFRFLDAGNITKRDLVLVACEHPGLALAEIEGALAGHPNLLPEEQVKHD